ncbi:MAG: response regulator [Candidatus Latescibacterota bacterium]|nr:MAG: response regulator [Candidatus Latescibacterota bacterium]
MLRKSVLLVVDDQGFLKAVTSLLTDYDVRTATSGAEALASMSTSKPDLVVLDVIGHASEELDMLWKLKGNPDTRAIPVVVLTAVEAVHDTGPTSSGTKGLPCERHLRKPLSPYVLCEAVEELLATKGRTRSAGQSG